jgi:hypothetical protein
MSDKERNGLFEMSADLVGSTARIGLTVASAPLVLLPEQSRNRVRRAMAEVARAVVVVPKEVSKVSERVVDEIFTGEQPNMNISLPSGDQISERAKAFTDRLARAADEFGKSVGRVANNAADSVEKTAARVDEWVEKPASTDS